MADVPEYVPMERNEQVIVTEQPGIARREQVIQDVSAERRQMLVQLTSLIWLLLIALEALIGLRIVLRLLAANANNTFAEFIYAISRIFVAPFLGLTSTPSFQGSVFEIPSLIAMVVYLIVTWFVIRLIWVVFDKPKAKSVSVYERYQSSKPGGPTLTS